VVSLSIHFTYGTVHLFPFPSFKNYKEEMTMTPPPNTSSVVIVREAIRCNNFGVAFAVKGQDRKAVSCFSHALRLFRQALDLNHEDDREVIMEDRESVSALHSSTYELPRSRNSSFFLFNSVVSLRQTDLPSSDDYDVYSSVIILNLAILYHRKTLSGGTQVERAEALRKAEHFYGIVSTIMANNNETTTPLSQPTSVLVQMVGLNNLGYMYSESGDFMGSSKRFRILGWLVRRTRSEFTKGIMKRRDLEGILLNVLMAKRQSVAPVA